MLRKQLAVLMLFAATVALTTPGMSQTSAQRRACTPDVWRLCKRYIPRRGAITQCLIANEASLSPACHLVIISR